MNKSEKLKLVEKILASREFSGSKVYQSYLTYLLHATEDGRNLKETTIAMEVFGKDAGFNPAEDTIVRSHTYTLRKKLESYYLNEGRAERYCLKIPKGHYELQISEREQDRQLSGNPLLRLSRGLPWLLAAGLLIIILYLLYYSNILDKRFSEPYLLRASDPVWKSFILSEIPVMIVPGDHYFYVDYFDKYGKDLTVRDVTINSDAELDTLRMKYPAYRIRPADEPYFPYHSLWSLPPILDIFFSVSKKPILRRSSVISPQILDEYNFIFIGSIKTLYVLGHVLAQSHFSFNVAPHIITYTPPDGGTVQTFKTDLHSTGPNEDLILALKLPGPRKNTIMIIASYHSLGAPDIANYLTTPARRKALEQIFNDRLGKFPEYFEILFRVVGIDKTAYTTEILICNEIVSGGEQSVDSGQR